MLVLVRLQRHKLELARLVQLGNCCEYGALSHNVMQHTCEQRCFDLLSLSSGKLPTGVA